MIFLSYRPLRISTAKRLNCYYGNQLKVGQLYPDRLEAAW